MKLILGFIVYGEASTKYLPFFLESLFASTFKDFQVLVIDNGPEKENKNQAIIKEKYPQIDLEWVGKNLGFAKAYNLMIKKAVQKKADFFLMLNPDMLIEPDMITKLYEKINSDEKIAVTIPKIFKWDFENNKKTTIIDSCGVAIKKNHFFFDRFQGEEDCQAQADEEVFGFSGAAALLRVKALEDVRYKDEYFDSLMFMYKEDCDLSYRLRLAAWKIIFVPEAIAYHDRTVSAIKKGSFSFFKERKAKSKQVKKWSFLNQWIIFLKFKHLEYSFLTRCQIFWRQFKISCFALFFETYLVKEFFTLFKYRKEIKNKAKNLKIKVNLKDFKKNWLKKII